MDSETIRQMDGPALAQYAYDLGLAPEGTTRHSDGRHWTEEGPSRQWVSWRPDERIDQAGACFRVLRALGWTTQTSYNPHTKVGNVRCVHQETAQHDAQGNLPWISDHFFSDPRHTEAHALLLVSVLATASSQEVPGG